MILCFSGKLTCIFWFFIAAVIKTIITIPGHIAELNIFQCVFDDHFFDRIHDDHFAPIRATFRDLVCRECTIFCK